MQTIAFKVKPDTNMYKNYFAQKKEKAVRFAAVQPDGILCLKALPAAGHKPLFFITKILIAADEAHNHDEVCRHKIRHGRFSFLLMQCAFF